MENIDNKKNTKISNSHNDNDDNVNFRNIDNILNDKNTLFAVLPADLRRELVVYVFFSLPNAINYGKIILEKHRNFEKYIDCGLLVENNKILISVYIKKFVSSKINENIKHENLKLWYAYAMEMYIKYANITAIITENTEYDIIYENANAIAQINDDINSNIKIDPQLLCKIVNKHQYCDRVTNTMLSNIISQKILYLNTEYPFLNSDLILNYTISLNHLQKLD